MDEGPLPDEVKAIDAELDEYWAAQMELFKQEKEGYNRAAQIANNKQMIDTLREDRARLMSVRDPPEPLPAIDVNEFRNKYRKILFKDPRPHSRKINEAIYNMSVPGADENTGGVEWWDIELFLSSTFMTMEEEKGFVQSFIGARLYWFPSDYRAMMQRTMAAESSQELALIMLDTAKHVQTAGQDLW